MTVATDTWISADCRSEIPRHASCVMTKSCACVCHKPRIARLRELREALDDQIVRLAARRARVDVQLAELDGRGRRRARTPAVRTASGYKVGELTMAIVDAIAPGETSTVARITDKIVAVHGDRWLKSTIATQVCIACSEGLIDRAGAGLYRLPEEET